MHRYAVRVFFEDTDLSGVVYHANYLRWFERARSDMLRLLGIDQRSVHESGGGAFAVAELTLRYHAPARLDETVGIESVAQELRAASSRMLQRAYLLTPDAPPRLLTEATLRIGFVGPDGRPRRQPQSWRDAFATIAPAPIASATIASATIASAKIASESPE